MLNSSIKTFPYKIYIQIQFYASTFLKNILVIYNTHKVIKYTGETYLNVNFRKVNFLL